MLKVVSGISQSALCRKNGEVKQVANDIEYKIERRMNDKPMWKFFLCF